MKRFKVQQFLDALKKDQIKWSKGTFFRDSGEHSISANGFSRIASACAVGIGAINLGIEPGIYGISRGFYSHPAQERVGGAPGRAADNIDDQQRHIDYKVQRAFGELVSFNDAHAQTWEDVVAKAESVFAPLANEEFEALEHDYSDRVIRTEVPNPA